MSRPFVVVVAGMSARLFYTAASRATSSKLIGFVGEVTADMLKGAMDCAMIAELNRLYKYAAATVQANRRHISQEEATAILEGIHALAASLPSNASTSSRGRKGAGHKGGGSDLERKEMGGTGRGGGERKGAGSEGKASMDAGGERKAPKGKGSESKANPPLALPRPYHQVRLFDKRRVHFVCCPTRQQASGLSECGFHTGRDGRELAEKERSSELCRAVAESVAKRGGLPAEYLHTSSARPLSPLSLLVHHLTDETRFQALWNELGSTFFAPHADLREDEIQQLFSQRRRLRVAKVTVISSALAVRRTILGGSPVNQCREINDRLNSEGQAVFVLNTTTSTFAGTHWITVCLTRTSDGDVAIMTDSLRADLTTIPTALLTFLSCLYAASAMTPQVEKMLVQYNALADMADLLETKAQARRLHDTVPRFLQGHRDAWGHVASPRLLALVLGRRRLLEQELAVEKQVAGTRAQLEGCFLPDELMAADVELLQILLNRCRAKCYSMRKILPSAERKATGDALATLDSALLAAQEAGVNSANLAVVQQAAQDLADCVTRTGRNLANHVLQALFEKGARQGSSQPDG